MRIILVLLGSIFLAAAAFSMDTREGPPLVPTFILLGLAFFIWALTMDNPTT